MRITTIRDLLLRVHTILSRDGVWVQWKMGQKHGPECQCLMTALNKVITDMLEVGLGDDARTILIEKLVAHIPKDQISKTVDVGATGRVLVEWNDADGRTLGEVLGLIMRTYDDEAYQFDWNKDAEIAPQHDPSLLVMIAEAIRKGAVGSGHPAPFGLFDYSKYGDTSTPYHIRDFRPGSPTRGDAVFRTNDGIVARIEFERLNREHQADLVAKAMMEWMNKRVAA